MNLQINFQINNFLRIIYGFWLPVEILRKLRLHASQHAIFRLNKMYISKLSQKHLHTQNIDKLPGNVLRAGVYVC